MANSGLTDLIPFITAALNTVSRELLGFIPAVRRNSNAERAALNQPIRIAIAPAAAEADNTPGTEVPDTGDQAMTYTDMTISKSKHVAVRWNGEETKGLENAGSYEDLMQQRFTQAFRRLANLIEIDLASTYTFASRAYGTAGTAPFGTKDDLSDVAGVWQILMDNGTPEEDLQLVLSTSAAANIMGKQASLFKANEAGTTDLLRRGSIGDLEGFRVHKSAQVKAHTKGTGINYLSDLVAGYVVGDKTLHLDTGTGTHVAGDVVTFTGDANKYVIGTGDAADGDKDVIINDPGLLATLANNVAATSGNSYRANMAFQRNAIQLVTRLPAMPKGGDKAIDTTQVVDPISGLVFEVAQYPGFLQETWHVRIAWGWKAIKPAHMAVLLG